MRIPFVIVALALTTSRAPVAEAATAPTRPSATPLRGARHGRRRGDRRRGRRNRGAGGAAARGEWRASAAASAAPAPAPAAKPSWTPTTPARSPPVRPSTRPVMATAFRWGTSAAPAARSSRAPASAPAPTSAASSVRLPLGRVPDLLGGGPDLPGQLQLHPPGLPGPPSDGGAPAPTAVSPVSPSTAASRTGSSARPAPI